MSPSPPMLHQPLFRLPLILDTVNEQAARLIFNNVHFVRDINAQTKLCFEDQLTVLEASWRDLFLIGASQMYPLMDPAEMGGITPDLVVQCIRFRDIISEFHNLQLSSEQYSIVKAVVLYRAGLDYDSEISSSPSSNGSGSPLSTGRLKDPRQVARLKMDAESMLWANIRLTSPTLCEIKLSRIAYLIPLLQLVSRKSIEDFFFRKAIGDTRIEKVITDIYVRSLNQQTTGQFRRAHFLMLKVNVSARIPIAAYKDTKTVIEHTRAYPMQLARERKREKETARLVEHSDESHSIFPRRARRFPRFVMRERNKAKRVKRDSRKRGVRYISWCGSLRATKPRHEKYKLSRRSVISARASLVSSSLDESVRNVIKLKNVE
ncbi:unnamed protein product [Trichogramma brassicae]|uniref:NR LBD domain-containing protein n=1 Tax=Trichogramma brassicae TaxID=86971 RepID=A0A6H5IIN2_9HYME|nr:unnamed protein product [Trichogramma brassicae]